MAILLSETTVGLVVFNANVSEPWAGPSVWGTPDLRGLAGVVRGLVTTVATVISAVADETLVNAPAILALQIEKKTKIKARLARHFVLTILGNFLIKIRFFIPKLW